MPLSDTERRQLTQRSPAQLREATVLDPPLDDDGFLRVEIDKQRTLFSQGKPAGKIDCGRGLADATLLIDYRDRLGQDNFLRARCFTWNTIPKGFVPRGT